MRSAALLLFLVAARAVAGPYSELFVFGDSLSDTGNTSYYTTDGPLAFLAPDTPGDAYWQGRFSNGPVFTEWLADGLGLGPLESSAFGGDNFAYGGAYTSGSPFGQNFYVDDLDDQIDDFLGNRTLHPDSLVTMLIGANDFLLGNQPNPSVPAGRVGDALADLAGAGGQNFLVLNLPWLGLTPEHNDSDAEVGMWNGFAIDYNLALASVLDAFELTNPSVTVHRLDLANLLNDLVANAPDWGFVNATDSAAPGLEPGDSGYDLGQVVDNPDEYVFWDGVHPTAAVHRLLGYAAVRAALPAGDYNRDGEVTLADYDVWRDAYGTSLDLAADGNGDGRIDAADYTLWRDALGTLAAAGMVDAAPAPTATWAAAIAISWALVGVRSGALRSATR